MAREAARKPLRALSVADIDRLSVGSLRVCPALSNACAGVSDELLEGTLVVAVLDRRLKKRFDRRV